MAIACLAGAACSTDPGDSATAAPSDAAGEGPSRQTLLMSLPELDRMVDSVMAETGVPGVAVAVVAGDEVVHTKGYGVRSTETGDPVDEETVFQVASMSKPISSTIMSALVSDGNFEWDDPISEYIDDFELSDPWVTDNVSFADLFAHRSGLPGSPAGNDLEAVGYPRDEILQRLAMVPLDPFRQDFSYSNWAMTLGGEAGAIASDTTWEEAATDYLFEPAGMDSTSMRHEDFLAEDNRSELHVETDEGWKPAFDRMPDGQAPAGGVSSNVVDLAEWVRLQMAGGSIDGNELVEPDVLDATHTPHVTKEPAHGSQPASAYGLGWNVGTNPSGYLEWNHSGAFSSGAATAVKIVPSAELGIVVLTNAAPIGVPEAIGDAWLGWILTRSGGDTGSGQPDADESDWLETWGERMGGVYGEALEVPSPAEPEPARETSAYEGNYSNDYVGEIEVATVDGALVLLAGPDEMVFALEHVDGDTFVYLDAPELPGYPALAAFSFEAGSDDEQAVAVNLSSFDGADLGTLERS